ncbi:hypothetical protein ILUMI_08917 [Ignelater luminosus]|uniref:Uncharacterized protein n=1 Tax=Ignelater luminosus TaxID=2038154 RepID=A0A8K0D3G7_IGNLU|nr:hypothetical protein ILUMI_08917 [Ignelater luminosus]
MSLTPNAILIRRCRILATCRLNLHLRPTQKILLEWNRSNTYLKNFLTLVGKLIPQKPKQKSSERDERMYNRAHSKASFDKNTPGKKNREEKAGVDKDMREKVADRKSPTLNRNRSTHQISSTVASLSSSPPDLSKATVPVIHALQAFEGVKKDITAATVMAIDPGAPFTVETDGSSFAVATTLSTRETSNHEYAHIGFPDGRELTVSTRDLASLPCIDENGSAPIEITFPSHKQDYTQVFSLSDPTPLQNSPASTVATPLPQNATTPLSVRTPSSATTLQSVIAPPSQDVASKHSLRVRRLPA